MIEPQTIVILIAIIVLIIIFLLLLFMKLNSKEGDINTIKKNFNNIYELESNKFSNYNYPQDVTNTDGIKGILPFSILTAFNCCNIGDYKNSFVHLESVKNCLRLGARCLDMEVYSYNNLPIVSSSISDSIYVKHTYNYLNLREVFEEIQENAFTSDNGGDNEIYGCKVSDYPLFLHIRVMSKNPELYRHIIELYIDIFNNRFTDDKLQTKNISDLKNKVILIINPYKSDLKLIENNSLITEEDKKNVTLSIEKTKELEPIWTDLMVDPKYVHLTYDTTVKKEEASVSLIIKLPNIKTSSKTVQKFSSKENIYSSGIQFVNFIGIPFQYDILEYYKIYTYENSPIIKKDLIK